VGAATFQPGLRLGSGDASSGGFQRELDAFLRDRLRLATKALMIAGVVLFVAMLGTRIHHFGLERGVRYAESWVILASTALMAGLHRIVTTRALSSRSLLAVDTTVLWLLLAACAVFYVAANDGENRQVVAFLGLVLVGRAVVVPSRPLRTFLLSIAALPLMLAVQLSLGQIGAKGLGPFPDSVFPTLVLWDQIHLLLSVGMAVLASRVNFALRRRAYEAKRIDRYVLEEKIGEGAMGAVYRARHALLRRPTAIKLMRPEIAGERNLKRFEREVQLTSRLTHPNTIQVFDYGSTPEGDFYYAMELLEGEDLARLVERTGPFPPGRALHVLDQACGALAEAHALGLVHRDVKPSNLLLCRQGTNLDVLKVMDFGLVKDVEGGGQTLTGVGEVCGSPETISPEVLRGEPVTAQADVYALGAVGCFLLTGKPIFDAETLPLFLAKHLGAPPIPPSARGAQVPADLEAALMRCLEKDPAARPPGAEALRQDLRACRDHGAWGAEEARAWWERQSADSARSSDNGSDGAPAP